MRSSIVIEESLENGIEISLPYLLEFICILAPKTFQLWTMILKIAFKVLKVGHWSTLDILEGFQGMLLACQMVKKKLTKVFTGLNAHIAKEFERLGTVTKLF